ncbi:MAG: YlxR family protein [Chloroflexi bacterium]|nr:YlxR family protein [Chloroflexota bacterium]
MPGRRHIPLRRCVVCRTQLPQRELVRIVKTPQGRVAVDTERKKTAGRGAYLCHTPTCWEQGLKKAKLDYALRQPMSAEDRQSLQEFARALIQQAQV